MVGHLGIEHVPHELQQHGVSLRTQALAGDDVHHVFSRDARVGREEVPHAEPSLVCRVAVQVERGDLHLAEELGNAG